MSGGHDPRRNDVQRVPNSQSPPLWTLPDVAILAALPGASPF